MFRRGVYSGRVTYICSGGGYILGVRGRFWDGRIYMFKGEGGDSGREGWILGGSHMDA